MSKPDKYVDYEAAWEGYAQRWRQAYPGLDHLGDEWVGREAGAAQSLAEYVALIEQRFVAPGSAPTTPCWRSASAAGARRHC